MQYTINLEGGKQIVGIGNSSLEVLAKHGIEVDWRKIVDYTFKKVKPVRKAEEELDTEE